MDRRQFTTGLVAALAGVASGCAVESAPSVPSPFSRSKLLSGLESLRLAFEAKGHHVSPSLLPGLAESTIRERCASWFPVAVPDEIIALYGWHEGQGREAWDETFPFWFRDCGFCSLAIAERSYKDIMANYATQMPDASVYRTAFPFAAFEGATLVLVTRPGGYHGVQRPVVSVHEGVDVWFHSMNTMIDTCIEWVSHPSWTTEDGESELVSRVIWERHNPGVHRLMMQYP